VKSWFSRAKARLSFANVTAALALFVALGGTSYAAATLPFNSVGKGQIKANAVGKSEAAPNSVGSSELRNSGVAAADIKTGAVGPSEVRPNAIDSDELADKGIKSADIADDAKAELTAANGVTFRAFSSADGATTGGTAKTVTKPAGTGVYTVDLGTDVSKCQSVASVSGAGATVGFATVTPASASVLTVNTFNGSGAAADRPFSLLVAC
jgi:hypothetical protein